MKNSGGQNAASALSITNTQMNTYPVGIGKVADEVALKDRFEDVPVHSENRSSGVRWSEADRVQRPSAATACIAQLTLIRRRQLDGTARRGSAPRPPARAGVPSNTSRPSLMKITRLHIASTSCRMCVESRIVLVSPSSRIVLADFANLVRIEAGGRLVEDQHVGLVQQHLGHADALAEALRQLADRLADHGCPACRGR